MTDELLIKFLLKECTEAENLDVMNWRSANEVNEQYYAQFEKIWDTSRALAPKSEVDENAAWTKFKFKATPSSVQEAIVVPIKRRFAWMRIAAVLIIAAGAWGTYSLFSSGYTDLGTDKQVLTQTLPDGSELTLNKNSQISYARNFKNHRNIKLKTGDVFFDVAKDKSKPFIIDIEGVAVEVVGTSFNIKHFERETEVNVESGVVKITSGKNQIKLYKGEKIILNSKTDNLVKQAVTDQLYNYYKTNLFIANDTPLWKLISAMNEAYGSSITLDSKIKDLTINTTLKQGSLEMNLQIICETLGLKQSHNGSEILLSY
jgi:transmembrane sensor